MGKYSRGRSDAASRPELASRPLRLLKVQNHCAQDLRQARNQEAVAILSNQGIAVAATSWWVIHPPTGTPAPLIAVPSPMSPLEQLIGPLMQLRCQVVLAVVDQASK